MKDELGSQFRDCSKSKTSKSGWHLYKSQTNVTHHSFTDDLQVQMSAPVDKISKLLHLMHTCISDIKVWATAT